jgi:hypothetical protein
VIFPSPVDANRLHAAFRMIVEEWAAQSARNQALLELVEAEIAKLRSGQ